MFLQNFKGRSWVLWWVHRDLHGRNCPGHQRLSQAWPYMETYLISPVLEGVLKERAPSSLFPHLSSLVTPPSVSAPSSPLLYSSVLRYTLDREHYHQNQNKLYCLLCLKSLVSWNGSALWTLSFLTLLHHPLVSSVLEVQGLQMTFPYLLTVTGKGASLGTGRQNLILPAPIDVTVYSVPYFSSVRNSQAMWGTMSHTTFFFFCYGSWSHIHTWGNVVVIEKGGIVLSVNDTMTLMCSSI